AEGDVARTLVFRPDHPPRARLAVPNVRALLIIVGVHDATGSDHAWLARHREAQRERAAGHHGDWPGLHAASASSFWSVRQELDQRRRAGPSGFFRAELLDLVRSEATSGRSSPAGGRPDTSSERPARYLSKKSERRPWPAAPQRSAAAQPKAKGRKTAARLQAAPKAPK